MFIGRVFAVANAEFLIGFSKTWMVEVNEFQGQLHRGFIGLQAFSVQTDGSARTSLYLVQLCVHAWYVAFPVGTVELWHMSIDSVGTIFVTLYVSKSAYSNYSQPATTFKCCGNKEMIVYGIC